jgi:hypothetical protein
MLIVLTAEIAAGVWAYQNSSKLEAFVKLNFKHTIETEYGVIDSRTEMVNAIQDHFECCGVDGPKDYSKSKLNNAKGGGFVDLAISSVKLSYSVPPSCCKNGTLKEVCDEKRKGVLTTSIGPFINKIVSFDRFFLPTGIFTNFSFRVAWKRWSTQWKRTSTTCCSVDSSSSPCNCSAFCSFFAYVAPSREIKTTTTRIKIKPRAD